MGRKEARSVPGRQPARRAKPGASQQGARDYRCTRGWQNHFGQFAAKDSSSEGGVGGVVRPDGEGGEAARREHGINRQDHSSLARAGSAEWWIQERRGQSAVVRNSGCRRGFDGGRATDGFTHKSAAAQFGPSSGRRRGPDTISRAGGGAGEWGTSATRTHR